MKSFLYSLSERVGLLPLIFKETEGGFYTAASEIPVFEGDHLSVERSGRFTSFYPDDEWYFLIADAFIKGQFDVFIINAEPEQLIKPFCDLMFANGVADGDRVLSEKAKKTLLAAEFLCADIIRTQKRNDPSPVLRRSEKVSSLYYDDYYSGAIEKTDKGYISRAASGIFSSVLKSLGGNTKNFEFYLK